MAISPAQERPRGPKAHRRPSGSESDRRLGEGGGIVPKRRVWTVEWRAAVNIEEDSQGMGLK